MAALPALKTVFNLHNILILTFYIILNFRNKNIKHRRYHVYTYTSTLYAMSEGNWTHFSVLWELLKKKFGGGRLGIDTLLLIPWYKNPGFLQSILKSLESGLYIRTVEIIFNIDF